ncbi:MAG: hypothetical protein U1E91_05225 [Moraxella sp.]
MPLPVIVENGRHGDALRLLRKMMDYWLIDKIKNPIVPPSPEELSKSTPKNKPPNCNVKR